MTVTDRYFFVDRFYRMPKKREGPRQAPLSEGFKDFDSPVCCITLDIFMGAILNEFTGVITALATGVTAMSLFFYRKPIVIRNGINIQVVNTNKKVILIKLKVEDSPEIIDEECNNIYPDKLISLLPSEIKNFKFRDETMLLMYEKLEINGSHFHISTPIFYINFSSDYNS